MSTPTIHDNDRKAAEEIVFELFTRYDGTYFAEEKRAKYALIIARHHAEERASVEKAKEALEFVVKHGVFGLGLMHEMKPANPWDIVHSALTALRNASQSPKTVTGPLAGWVFHKARPGDPVKLTTAADVEQSLRARDIHALCEHGQLSHGGWNWFSEPTASQSPTEGKT